MASSSNYELLRGLSVNERVSLGNDRLRLVTDDNPSSPFVHFKHKALEEIYGADLQATGWKVHFAIAPGDIAKAFDILTALADKYAIVGKVVRPEKIDLYDVPLGDGALQAGKFFTFYELAGHEAEFSTFLIAAEEALDAHHIRHWQPNMSTAATGIYSLAGGNELLASHMNGHILFERQVGRLAYMRNDKPQSRIMAQAGLSEDEYRNSTASLTTFVNLNGQVPHDLLYKDMAILDFRAAFDCRIIVACKQLAEHFASVEGGHLSGQDLADINQQCTDLHGLITTLQPDASFANVVSQSLIWAGIEPVRAQALTNTIEQTINR